MANRDFTGMERTLGQVQLYRLRATKALLAPVPKRSASTLVVNQASKACTHEGRLRFKPEQQCNAWLSLVEMKSNNN